MISWKRYLQVQLKRVGKALPGICLLTAFLTLGLMIFTKAMFLIEESKAENRAVCVGIVGDIDDTYLGIGINVIKNMEGIKNLADIQTMTEEEAKRKFASGEISAYLLVPDGFIDSVIYGENKQLTYVTNEIARDIGGVLINELVGSISGMVTMTQTSIQAMQSYMIEHGMQDELGAATEGINVAYIEVVMNRMEVFELEELGVSNSISFTGHLFTGILLLLMLLWGINAVTLLVREENSLIKIMHTRGLDSRKQVLAEVGTYSVLQCVTLLCVFVCVLIIKSFLGLSIREWDVLEAGEKLLFVVKLLPVVVLTATIQAFLYELVTNVVTGVLLQFVVAVSMAFVSGCIYPLSFFPEVLQVLGKYSPMGAALRYLQKSLTLRNGLVELGIMILYILFFLGLHICKRNVRITKE
ncbi:MAG: ABC transporter permease [Lachnospiraceae bacterium]|nr:ABC transporter permease [Lachnospiraceae bacterium]